MALGGGGAGHVALGRLAVRLALTVPALSLLLSGCSAVAAVSGAIAGASTGAATANPIVGYTTAVAVNAGVSSIQKYVVRVRQGDEQNNIAELAGLMPVGAAGRWKVDYLLPFFANQHGRIAVVSLIATPLTACKEVLFTVDRGKPPHEATTPYTTDACRDTAGWRWAAAEPAVPRWGFFQHIGH
jgi:uncharacterized protein YceK